MQITADTFDIVTNPLQSNSGHLVGYLLSILLLFLIMGKKKKKAMASSAYTQSFLAVKTRFCYLLLVQHFSVYMTPNNIFPSNHKYNSKECS